MFILVEKCFKFGQFIVDDEHVIELFIYVKFPWQNCQIPYGLVVRIRRSHRRGPGSIPGVGRTNFFCLLLDIVFFFSYVLQFISFLAWFFLLLGSLAQ